MDSFCTYLIGKLRFYVHVNEFESEENPAMVSRVLLFLRMNHERMACAIV